MLSVGRYELALIRPKRKHHSSGAAAILFKGFSWFLSFPLFLFISSSLCLFDTSINGTINETINGH